MTRFTLTKQSWKNKRRMEAPIRASFDMADCMLAFTVERSLGQELE